MPDWKIWIDTGGTFTDCVAVDKNGTMHREKVLSSAALRGVVRATPHPTRLTVDIAWTAPRDFIAGFEFSLLDYTSAGDTRGRLPQGVELRRTRPLARPDRPPAAPR
jgi:hypothetical protein